MTYFMVKSLCLAWMEGNRKCMQVNSVNADGETGTKFHVSLTSVRDEYEW
jgi:hypothetical protein